MKTNSLFKRLVSMLIVVLMICTVFPVTALAYQWQPSAPGFEDLFPLLKVEIDCDTESEEDEDEDEDEDKHPKITYDLLNNTEGSYDSFSVTQTDILGYFYTVTVYSARYIDKYEDEEIDGEKFGPHSPKDDEDEDEDIDLVYKNVGTLFNPKWKLCLADDEDGKIDFEVECDGASTPEPAVTGITKTVMTSAPTDLTNVPTGITYPDANNIATVPYGTTSVTLLYKVTVSGDAGAEYAVTDDNATLISGKVSGTIPDGGEVVLYFTKTFTGLTTGDNPCSNTAAVKDTNFSATANVTVKVSAPAAPTENDFGRLFGNNAVKIHCTKDTEHNDDETYGLISSTYNIGNVETDTNTGKYTCTITVTDPSPYAEQYNSDKHSKGFTNEHTLCPDQGSKTIILEYNESTSKWNIKTDSAPVTFNVVCGDVPTEPEPPAKEYLEKLLANGAVTIDCVNSEVDHEDKTYGLLTGSYDIGKPQKYGETDVYTCEITVYAAPYVAQYSTDMNKGHSLADVGSKKVILVYKGDEWIVPPVELAAGDDFEYESAFPVTFNVVCKETPVTTYTVTYKDGVGGKVFKDDVHTVESGATTPAFVGGIPTRPGYVFVGWTPAVSKTVTGDATYTATWRKVKDTTVIEIGGGNSSSSSSKEENPNTGAPVFVGVSVGALAAAK